MEHDTEAGKPLLGSGRDKKDLHLVAPTEGGTGADAEEDAKPKGLTGRALVLFLFACLTFVATLEKVSLKKAVDSMSDFQVLLNQIVVLLFALIFSGVVAYKLRYTDEITPEMRAFPKLKLALISICDTTAGILILIPTRHVDGSLMTLLLQGVVPFTMLFSVVLLKKKFHWLHYAGTAVILIGILLNTLPSMEGSDQSLVDGKWYLLPLFLSCVPMALSGICQQIALQDQEMDIYYYQMWVAWFQFLLSLVVSPLSFAMQTPGTSIKELGDNFYRGMLCWIPGAGDGVSPPLPAECSDAFAGVAVYLGLCIVFNLFISLVVKYGDAVTMMVALTMAVPLQYIVFAIKTPFFVPEPATLVGLNWAGLAVTVLGLVGYHAAQDPDAHEGDGEGVKKLPPIGSMSPTMSPFMSRTPTQQSPRSQRPSRNSTSRKRTHNTSVQRDTTPERGTASRRGGRNAGEAPF